MEDEAVVELAVAERVAIKTRQRRRTIRTAQHRRVAALQAVEAVAAVVQGAAMLRLPNPLIPFLC